MTPLAFGSLFSGIEGFGLGFENAGMVCEWQSEINEACNSVRQRHWPNVRQVGDVCGATAIPRVDCICGGFPCQDLSVAGRRAGLAGKRSGLFHEFMRVVGELTPTWVVIENVPGLLSSNGTRDMGTVLWTLGQLGYGWAYRILDAQWFGVAQRRRRVFIVGCIGGDYRRAAEILFERESLPWDSAPSREAGTRIAASLTQGSGVGSNPPGRRREDDVNLALCLNGKNGNRYDGESETFVTGTLNSGGNNGGFRSEPGEHLVTHSLTADGHDASEDGTGRGTPLAVGLQMNFIRKERIGDYVGSISANPGNAQFNGVWARSGVRRLTPRECERLQGFPDDWTRYGHDGKEISDSARYRMLGNAVAVPVAEWIGRRIVEASA